MSIEKVLLGGVPFGCNNIGDEAILAQVVSIIRNINSEIEITVSTGDPIETQKLLHVKTCPLYGFDEKSLNKNEFIEALKQVDTFIWSGATGLSDYPDTSLNCLAEAQKIGIKTVIFCTGMNDKLNPAHFKLVSGKKYALLSLLTFLSGNTIDFIKTYETRKEQALRRRLKKILDKCDLVINRDHQSSTQVMRSQLHVKPIIAADPAITLPIVEPSNKIWGDKLISFVEGHKTLIGICISSQQGLTQRNQFVEWLDSIVRAKNVGIVFIPMNPITDFEVMADMRESMLYRDSTIIASGSNRPEAVVGLAARMDIIISSRLHLLIFASISATPCIGIGRGSKVKNFLSEFGQCTAGTTAHIDFNQLDNKLTHLLSNKGIYKKHAIHVHHKMLNRLNTGINALSSVIDSRVSAQRSTKQVKLQLGDAI